ncbi:MAG TPA: TonB-dependent receptor [Gemmatimonadaceae bacterium]|jgi:vitamin B12 transporter
MRSILALSTIIIVRLAFASPVAAQRPDSLRDTARIAPVVVTATSTPLSLDRVPAAVTVLDGASLRAQGLTHVADALREVPGMAVVQSGSYGAPISLFTRGAQNNYTKVLVDGVPLNDPGGALDLGLLTLDDVERIEIVRGPASVLYGSDAVAGVVQIFTRQGNARPRGSVDARGGTYGSYDLDATADAPIGILRASLGAAHHVTDGIYDFNSRYRNDVGNASLTFAPWRNTEITGTARYDDAIAHYPTDFTGAPVDPNAYRTEKRTLIGADVRQQIGRARASLALSSNLANESTIDPPNGPGDFGSSLITRTFRQAADLRLGVPVASALMLTVGGTAERQHEASPDYDRRNEAAYTEVVRSGELTTATFGARLDHSSTFGDFATYRASVSRALPGALRVRASLGTAFREPAFYESFDTPFSAANPDLRPERTTSWETGLEHEIAAGTATIGATYFNQRFVDLIDYRFDAANPAQSQYENIARARAAGAEVELRIMPRHGLSGDASYTWLDTKVLQSGFDPSPQATLVSGGPLLRRPKHSGSVGVRYDFLGGLSATARATYVGTREDRLFHGAPDFNTDDVTLDPYTKVDASFVAPLAAVWSQLRSIDATLRADNLFDTRYVSVAGYATPGRVITAGVRATF